MDLSNIENKLSRIEGAYLSLKHLEKNYDDEIILLEKEIILLNEVSKVVNMLLQTLLKEDTDSIKSLVTEGLQAIFDDQDLELQIDTSIKRSKVSLELNVSDNRKHVCGDVIDSFGGGVSNIVSLLFRFIAVLKMNLYRLLLLDESLANVSEEYIDNAGIFLKTLCNKLKFDILLVTHQPKFLAYADNSYQGDIVDNSLKLNKIKI
jgi:DNA repair ATPase RecN